MRYQINDAVVWTATGDQVRMYDTEAGEFHTLNDSAARIWTMIEEGAEVDAISRRLGELFNGGDPDEERVIAADVRQFVDSLVARQILVPAGGPDRG